jgi:hypothetical protein
VSVDIPTLIESLSPNNEDQRNLYYAFYNQFQLLNKATGNNFSTPVNSTQKASTQPPNVGSISVSGANGVYQANVVNASQGGVNATLYNQVRYSPIKSFGQSVTTMEPSTATSVTVPNPGQTLFFQARWSFDRVNWSSWVLAATTAIASNLQSSAASENNTVLNQSNYLYVDSIDAGATANVRVYGAAGPYNGGTTIKGGAETAAPSATIVNVAHNTNQIVAYDGEQYQVASTLPGVFSDSLTPIGQVSVVGTGTPTLPTFTPIVSGGYVTGLAFTPGSGLTEAPIITISSSGSGAGATATCTVAGGVCTATQITNPGNGSYTAGTTSASSTGGVFGGATGGGTASGGNGGRLTKI